MPQETQPWTVRRLLEWTAAFFARKKIEPTRLSAEQLLAHVLGVPRIKLYTDFERIVEPGELAKYRELVSRAGESEPIAYLTGRAHFFNLELEVNRDVLIPRPDSETIVEHVLQWLRGSPGPRRILDLCTGSGCIAIAIAHHNREVSVVATDDSAAALAVARRNVERYNLGDRVTLAEGDLFEAVAGAELFDAIVANPPYISAAQMGTLDRSVRDFEPIVALQGGENGLEFHRRILEGLPALLVGGGRVYMEIAFDQGSAIRELVKRYPALAEVAILRDQGGRDRVLSGIWKP